MIDSFYFEMIINSKLKMADKLFTNIIHKK